KFDNVYLGIKYSIKCITGSPDINKIFVQSRRFYGTTTDVYESSAAPSGINRMIDNILDQYFISRNNNNKNFYYSTEYTTTIGGVSYKVLPGHAIISFSGLENEAQYKAVRQVCVKTQVVSDVLNEWEYSIDELVIMFHKSVSIKKAVYSPFKARIFDDTWGGRKTAANLMENPKDLLEHFNRLQCFSDSSSPPSGGWGKGYAVGAKIKTGFTGLSSFDNVIDANFTILDDYKAAGQILDYDEMYTDKLKRSVCIDFHLGSWVNKDGEECVNSIIKSETSPPDAITLADIVDLSSIVITEPSPADIFPEPFVRYRKNFATGEYESLIKVTNVDAETYVAGYVEGLTDSEAEEIWDRCHALWLKAKHLEKPPSNLTDKIWFNGVNADIIARDYIFNWVDWMFNPSISFKVHYNKAGSWEETHRFTIQLPHQTADTVFECLLTKITVDPNPPFDVTIDAIIFRETIPEDYLIKDTWINYGDDNDWKDMWVNYGDDNDKVDTM
ncbi:MAG: hypothetical protein ABII90_15625, partial [Bacteroidota bacterium]